MREAGLVDGRFKGTIQVNPAQAYAMLFVFDDTLAARGANDPAPADLEKALISSLLEEEYQANSYLSTFKGSNTSSLTIVAGLELKCDGDVNHPSILHFNNLATRTRWLLCTR